MNLLPPTPSPKRLAVGLTAVTIVLLSLFGWLIYHAVANRGADSLARLLPTETLFYLHLDYSGRQSTPWLNNFWPTTFDRLDQTFFPDQKLNFATGLKTYLDDELAVAQTAPDQWLLLLKIKKAKQLLPLLAGQERTSLLAGQYLVVGKNANDLAAIKIETADSAKTLNARLPWSAQPDSRPIKLYLHGQALASFLPLPATRLLTEFLTAEPDLNFYLAADNNLNFTLTNNLNWGAGTLLLKSQLPPDTIFTLTNDNFWNLTQELGQKLLAVDPRFYRRWLSVWQDYQNNYALNLTAIKPLLRQPAQLVVNRQNDGGELSYTLIFRRPANFDPQSLETLLKNLIARNFPEAAPYRLPDGTMTQELISNPNNFRLEEVEFNQQTFKIVRNHQPIWEIAYTLTDEQLLISNSLTALEQFFAPAGQINLTTNCPELTKPQLYFLWPKFFGPPPLRLTDQQPMTGITLQWQNSGLTGCLRNLP